MQQIGMIGDKIVPFEEIDSVYQDRGTFFGDGVYEVIRSYNGKIFAFEEHMKRFENSLKAIEITSIAVKDVRQRVLTAFEKAAIANAKIYFHVTRGCEPRNHNWAPGLKPTFFMTITTLPDATEMKEKGVGVSLYPDLRWKRCDIKSLNLLPNVMAHNDAAKKGCFDAILVGDDGLITEGSSSAFFEIFGDSLYTTALGTSILPSVSRIFVVKCARNIGLNIVEESIPPQKAKQADELFLGVTTRDILPVVKFDDKIIGDGRPGKSTKQIEAEFRKFTG